LVDDLPKVEPRFLAETSC